jgi:hypothetical protein
MIADAFGRLRSFGALEDYQYVGFGSTYFVDFTYFHRRLGFMHLVSIEADDFNRERFEFNNPLGMIDLRFGLSTDVLPTLDWVRRSVVWLDYDSMLDATVLADLAYVCALVPSGSVVMATVNAHSDDATVDKLEALQERVGEARVPIEVTRTDLAGWGLAAVGRRIMHGTIEDSLRSRSAGGMEWRYRQLFNFEYQDRPRMSTVGGLIYDAGQERIADACGFGDYGFIRPGDDAYRIAVPNITLHEARYFASRLPIDGATQLFGVPPEEAEAYGELYRYFPTFIDAELI